MPMTDKRYARIKKQLNLWMTGNLEDSEHLDKPVLVDIMLEMRGVLNELVTANEEETPSLIVRALPYVGCAMLGAAVALAFGHFRV